MSQILSKSQSERMELDLCKRLVDVRLMKNINQRTIAEMAGVFPRTISRMENGKVVTLDTFIRVMSALGIADQLSVLAPASEIRPVERVCKGRERKHASSPRKKKDSGQKWQWGTE